MIGDPYYSSELYRVRRRRESFSIPNRIVNASDIEVARSRPKNVFNRVLTYLACLQNCGIDASHHNVTALAVMDDLICPRDGRARLAFTNAPLASDEIDRCLATLMDRKLISLSREVDNYSVYETGALVFAHAYARRRTNAWAFALWQIIDGLFSNDTVKVSVFESGQTFPLIMRRALDGMVEIQDSFYDICRKEIEQPASSVFWRFGFYAALQAKSHLQPREELSLEAARDRNQTYSSRRGLAPDGKHHRGLIWSPTGLLAEYHLLGPDVTSFQWHQSPTPDDSLQVLWEMMSASSARRLPAKMAGLFDAAALTRASYTDDAGDRILPNWSIMRMPEPTA